jgi:hypothetical protein
MKKRIARKTAWGIGILIVLLGLWATLTNPFVKWSVIKSPFDTTIENGQIKLLEVNDVTVYNRRIFRRLAEVKSGWYILLSRFIGGHKTKENSLGEIIGEIHNLRFDPSEPFLISGDHFSVFYPRSLGIFYHSALDSRTALNDDDWNNRQRIYLQSTAYALEVFDKAGELSTTVVPIAPKTVSLVNVYARPSDTLYSLLYALEVLTKDDYISTVYPYGGTQKDLMTAPAASGLLEKYKDRLAYFLDKFESENVDSNTGLIRKDVLLSSTKDITMRSSAFYDNVIYWKTLEMASDLGVRKTDKEKLVSLKAKILEQFWYEKGGYFLEDLSEESISQKYYSSDWLIAYMTGFLDPNVVEDRTYLSRSLEYISGTGLNRPVGLPYQGESRRSRQYPLVRFMANDYGSLAIWSNWGMEYAKLLISMFETTGKKNYMDEAQFQLGEYEKRIVLYRGYPEVYDRDGKFFSKLFYKSVRRTGWVVSFEQAKAMFDSVSKKISVDSK